MIARGNQWAYVNHMCRLPVETYEDLWRPMETTEFDWLMLPTTINKIIGIKKPNLHKIPGFP